MLFEAEMALCIVSTFVDLHELALEQMSWKLERGFLGQSG